MTSVFGTIHQARNNSYIFTDSKSNDLLFSAKNNSQSILMGFTSNVSSTFKLSHSNFTLGSLNSNVSTIINGTLNVSENTTFNKNITSSNSYVQNILGVGTITPNPLYNLHVNGSTRIEGDLIVNGVVTNVNTNVAVTDQLIITNDGTGPVLVVNQVGAQPIVTFMDDSNVIFHIEDGGYIAMGSQDPTEKLDVDGNILVRGNIRCSNILTSNLDTRNINVSSNITITNNATANSFYGNNLFMGNSLIIDNTGVITNSNYIPSLNTSKIISGTFTSNFIENRNIISEKIASNISLGGIVHLPGFLGVGTSNPQFQNINNRFSVVGGDMTVTGLNNFTTTGHQARINIGNCNHFIGATCNVGIFMQVPGTNFPFVLEQITGFVGLGIQDPEERLHVINNAKISSNLYVLNRIGINNSNPNYTLDVQGDVNITGLLYNNGIIYSSSRWSSNNTTSNIYRTEGRVSIGSNIHDELFNVYNGNVKFSSNLYILNRFGISTSNLNVGLEINTTDAILIPKGTTLQRPTGVLGYVRYNTTLSTFEGFGSGNTWGSLGGVKDTNQDTFVSAESFPTSNDDNIRFINSNIETARITKNGFLGLGTSNPTEKLDLLGGNGKFSSNLYVSNRIGISTSNPLVSLEINSDDAILIPKGTTLERPNGVLGYIRYNTTLSTFEGFGSGNTWGSLGGVKDTNQDTFVSAESFPTSNDDNIRFINSNIETARITKNGFLGIGTSNPLKILEVHGDVNIGIGNKGNELSNNGGPFFIQQKWNNSNSTHVINYPSYCLGDNSAGTINIQIASKIDSNQNRCGNVQLSFIKPYRNNLDLLEVYRHINETITDFNISTSSNDIIITTNSNCSISWTSIGSY